MARPSNGDLENIVTVQHDQEEVQFLPERQSAGVKQSAVALPANSFDNQAPRQAQANNDTLIDDQQTDQSIAVTNPFDHVDISVRRSLDGSSKAHLVPQLPEYEDNAYFPRPSALLKQSQHSPAPSDPSLYHLQTSYKSIDLLEGTSNRNQALLVQQLQRKCQQLQQQMSFQKKEFDMRIEEKVLQSIQNRDDLLRELTSTKKELDNSNKEKHKMLSHF